MAEKIVLIDGHSILHRAFYGIPDLTNAEGLHTNAIYGFLNILFKLLEEEKPEYVIVAFDVHAPTFRHKMFEAYKGTRKPMADELREQVPVIKDVLKAMGVKVIEQAGLEADDLIGTLAKRCETAGMVVSVISGDRDLLQLATDTVQIRIPKTIRGTTQIENYYAKDVKERYQVTPLEFIDVKGLMGDASDNIPGVPSIGEKTATKIIVEFGSIERAYEHIEELTPPRAAKALQEHYELAKLSKELATIIVDAGITCPLEEAKIGELYTQEAYAWFQKLQFKNFLNRFEVQAPSHEVEAGFQVIDTREMADSIFEQAKRQHLVGAVLYKSSEDVLPLFAHMAELGGIGIAFDAKHTYCIPIAGEITREYLLAQLEDVAKQVATISMFDFKEHLPTFAIPKQENCFDVTIAAYLLNPLKSDYAYEDVAREYLSMMLEDKSEEHVKVCYQAHTAYAAHAILHQKLEEQKLDKLFYEIEMPLLFALYEMEQVGIRVAREELKEYGDKLEAKIAVLEKCIYEEAGEEFNINSPKQLGVVLFEHLGIEGGKKTKTGYSTAADVLEKLAPEYPVVNHILEYRQVAKLKSTYADGLANFIGADERIHGKFNQTITATGRISSAEPNLQNIPIRMELGHLIRKVFIPKEEYVFVDADYSQIELRILAHCSGDKALIEAYRHAEDIHRITASQVFHVPFEEVTELQRRNAKAVNFGIVYGISSFGLSQDLSITRKEATQYIERYFASYPGIKKFLDNTVQQAKDAGYVETLFGRRRPVPELKSSNFMQRSFGERVAMNAPIQGSAADIMKLAMLGVLRALKAQGLRSRIVLQVHDELLIEAHKDEVEQVKAILTKEMEQAVNLDVPLLIDIHTGQNWYEAK